MVNISNNESFLFFEGTCNMTKAQLLSETCALGLGLAVTLLVVAGCGRPAAFQPSASNDAGLPQASSDEIPVAKWTEYRDPDGQVVKLLAYHGRVADRLSDLPSRPTVQEVVFQECQGLTADTFASLADFPQLRRLAVLNSPLPEKALEGIGKLAQLRSLQLINCGLEGETAAALSNLPLEELEIMERELAPEAAAVLSAIPTLKVLRVGSSGIEISDLTGIAGHPTLEELDVRICRSGNGWTSLVRQVPHLKRLFFDGRILDEQVLSELTQMPTLEELDLSSSPITDEQLAQLAELPNLRVLSLRNCEKLTEAALEKLAGFPKLERLDISESTIPGAAVPKLIPLKTLNDLTVHQMQLRGDNSAVEQFRQARPDCTVTIEQDLMF
ncbi:MAG: hypothetical protein KatS3mg110_3889 [Pirellulaceae bacterium]|nr:MAG: hypothetical protein KatS3mg110_3889 [Pirellulaceae bacterium]